MALCAVIAVFSLVGFENATSLGEEARDPLRTIPRAVIWSVVLAGTFFGICVYGEVFATRGAHPSLDRLTTPLDTVAGLTGVPWLRIPIDAGALFSAFSVALASLNAGGRVLCAMGRSGLLPAPLAHVHATHRSPSIALTVFAGVSLVLCAGMLLAGLSSSDAFNDTATLGSFGFIAIYLAVAAGAPLYLKRLGELRGRHVAVAAIAVLCSWFQRSEASIPCRRRRSTRFRISLPCILCLGRFGCGAAAHSCRKAIRIAIRASASRYETPRLGKRRRKAANVRAGVRRGILVA